MGKKAAPKKHTKTAKGLLLLKSVKGDTLSFEMCPNLDKKGDPLPNEILGNRQLKVAADFLPEDFDIMYDSVLGTFEFKMEAANVTPRPTRKKR